MGQHLRKLTVNAAIQLGCDIGIPVETNKSLTGWLGKTVSLKCKLDTRGAAFINGLNYFHEVAHGIHLILTDRKSRVHQENFGLMKLPVFDKAKALRILHEEAAVIAMQIRLAMRYDVRLSLNNAIRVEAENLYYVASKDQKLLSDALPQKKLPVELQTNADGSSKDNLWIQYTTQNKSLVIRCIMRLIRSHWNDYTDDQLDAGLAELIKTIKA